MLERIMEQYTIEVVANRTKISRKNLEKLASGEFSGLTRPQATGFIKILEREFAVDLSDLKSRLDNHFEETGQLDDAQPIFISAKDEADEKSSSVKWLVFLLILALSAGGYYFYTQNIAADTSDSVDKTRASEVIAPEHETLSPLENGSGQDVAEAGPQSPDVAAESAMTQESREDAALSPEEVPGEEATATTEEKRDANETTQETKDPETPKTVYDPVVVKPKMKLWYGVVDLATGKRRSATTDKPFEIDANSKKLLQTGHGRFEISDGEGNLEKLNDVGKHYFLIENGEMKEIDRNRYKELNGGKIW